MYTHPCKTAIPTILHIREIGSILQSVIVLCAQAMPKRLAAGTRIAVEDDAAS